MGYQRNQTYRETKMRLLHKLAGLEWLEYAYKGSKKKERHWFKGYKVYNTREDIILRFQKGRPISCFGSKTGGKNLHVAYEGRSRFEVEYVTIECNTQSMNAVEMGVHFCQFRFVSDTRGELVVEETTTANLRDNIVDDRNALMLPYKKDNIQFQNQYTLVYHDWDALVCDDSEEEKGFPSVDYNLFGDKYTEQLGMV